MSDTPKETITDLVALLRKQADDVWHVPGHQDCSRAFADFANRIESALAGTADPVASPTPPRSVDEALDIYAPGAWKCPKCDFHLQKQTIFMQSGTIGSSRDDVMNVTGEVCPNDSEPMIRETWRERSDANYKFGVDLMEQIIALTGKDSLPAAIDEIKRLRASPVSEAHSTPQLESVYEACGCPAKPGEPCPLSEMECAARCRKSMAVRYLEKAAKLSGCSWKCYAKYVNDGFDAYCSSCQNIALAMVDALIDGRSMALTLRVAPVSEAGEAPTHTEKK